MEQCGLDSDWVNLRDRGNDFRQSVKILWDMKKTPFICTNLSDITQVNKAFYDGDTALKKNAYHKDMSLTVMNKDSSEWLQFDVVMRESWVHVFVNSDTLHCYLIKRVVDHLNLKLENFSDSIWLEKDKWVSFYGFIWIL